jgi:hypothetical protein
MALLDLFAGFRKTRWRWHVHVDEQAFFGRGPTGNVAGAKDQGQPE